MAEMRTRRHPLLAQQLAPQPQHHRCSPSGKLGSQHPDRSQWDSAYTEHSQCTSYAVVLLHNNSRQTHTVPGLRLSHVGHTPSRTASKLYLLLVIGLLDIFGQMVNCNMPQNSKEYHHKDWDQVGGEHVLGPHMDLNQTLYSRPHSSRS